VWSWIILPEVGKWPGECKSICFSLDCDVDRTQPRPPMLMPSGDCGCTYWLKLTELRGPSCISQVKALAESLFSVITAISVQKNKIHRKYVHLFRPKNKRPKSKKTRFRQRKRKKKMKYGWPLESRYLRKRGMLLFRPLTSLPSLPLVSFLSSPFHCLPLVATTYIKLRVWGALQAPTVGSGIQPRPHAQFTFGTKKGT